MTRYRCHKIGHITKNCWVKRKYKQQNSDNKGNDKAIDIEKVIKDFSKVLTKEL